MAEGFARAYGSDVLVPASAGLTPATQIAPDTIRAMAEKGIDLRSHFTKHIHHLSRIQFDLIINMSGSPLPESLAEREVRTWEVEDPVWMNYEDHCAVRDQIERLVMELILELRRAQQNSGLRGMSSTPNL